MDVTPRTGDGADGDGWEDTLFIEGASSSDDELDFDIGNHKHRRTSSKQTAALSVERSPPLLLAFSITSGPKMRDDSPSPASSLGAQAEEEAIEEWMILGRGEQPGDSSIHLNLSYWKSSEEDSPDEGQCGNLETNSCWAVSEKDKGDTGKLLPVRYFVPSRSQICSICNRTGHLSSSCYYQKKSPMCILCGTRGHVCRDCPSRPCSSCGLPSHVPGPCKRPPVWNQHCQRCGVAGHLLDACPDTWRQYHLTVRQRDCTFPPILSKNVVTLEVPLRPHKQKHKKSRSYCYNCSGRGHRGHECTKRRMVSGTFPSVPYVCHYDTIRDVMGHHTRMQNRVNELLNTASVPDLQPPETTKKSDTGSQTVKEGSRVKPETLSRAGRRKTWPERRRERREVKRLRREAQARREGTVLERSPENYDEDFTAGSFSSPLQGHWHATDSPRKKRKGEEGGTRTRKTEKWKKRGGIKHTDFYSDAENFNSLKRVQQRRR
ncbi:zinc finger CCHC domain-containing protein 7-like isoform X2 [Takifugu rubripes]|uniref:zinc finger CCHC domain-containing protein 7-like isoform X2 n=1 Tax=Takifugu rubripes TaxID=31033 RepID=UPI001145DA61|nr:zinc finger CCHC domain-containing protein 7-like isoform X2 [Takifugu rubripes]